MNIKVVIGQNLSLDYYRVVNFVNKILSIVGSDFDTAIHRVDMGGPRHNELELRVEITADLDKFEINTRAQLIRSIEEFSFEEFGPLPQLTIQWWPKQ